MRTTLSIILSTIFISVSALFVTTERIIGVPVYEISTDRGVQQYIESSSYDILADAIISRINVNITNTGSFNNSPTQRTTYPSVATIHQADYHTNPTYPYGEYRAIISRKNQVNHYIYALHRIRI